MTSELQKLRNLMRTPFLPASMSFLVFIHFLIPFDSYQGSVKPIGKWMGSKSVRFHSSHGWPFIDWYYADIDYLRSSVRYGFYDDAGMIANTVLMTLGTLSTYLLFNAVRRQSSIWQFSLRGFMVFVLAFCFILAAINGASHIRENILPNLGLTEAETMPRRQVCLFVLIGLCCTLIVTSKSILWILEKTFFRVGYSKPEALD